MKTIKPMKCIQTCIILIYEVFLIDENGTQDFCNEKTFMINTKTFQTQ